MESENDCLCDGKVNACYIEKEGLRFSRDGLICLNCSNQRKSIVVPNGTLQIGDRAFCRCEHIEKVVLPKGLSRIGRGAFLGCSSLCEVVLPSGLREIDIEAFAECVKLSRIIIPESVECIHAYSFRDCSSLSELIVRNANTKIGYHSLLGCPRGTRDAFPEQEMNVFLSRYIQNNNLSRDESRGQETLQMSESTSDILEQRYFDISGGF